jgi:hypothetical protein
LTWALLLAQNGEREKAVELFALAERHPSSNYETKTRAERELAELAGDLPARIVRAAKEHGRSRDWRLAAVEVSALIEQQFSVST